MGATVTSLGSLGGAGNSREFILLLFIILLRTPEVLLPRRGGWIK